MRGSDGGMTLKVGRFKGRLRHPINPNVAPYVKYSYYINSFNHTRRDFISTTLNRSLVMTSLAAPTACLPRRGPVKQTGMGWEAWLR